MFYTDFIIQLKGEAIFRFNWWAKAHPTSKYNPNHKIDIYIVEI